MCPNCKCQDCDPDCYKKFAQRAMKSRWNQNLFAERRAWRAALGTNDITQEQQHAAIARIADINAESRAWH